MRRLSRAFGSYTVPLWHDRDNLWSDRQTDVRLLNNRQQIPPPPTTTLKASPALRRCDANRLFHTADEAFRQQASGSQAATGLTCSSGGGGREGKMYIRPFSFPPLSRASSTLSPPGTATKGRRPPPPENTHINILFEFLTTSRHNSYLTSWLGGGGGS